MKKSSLDEIRHSLSHIMAAAVIKIYPEAKLGIGPPVDNGFYYDFELPRTVSNDDLISIEKEMRQLIHRSLEFRKKQESKLEQLQKYEAAGQKYKAELVKDIDEPEQSIYDIADCDSDSVIFSDLCKGPHVPDTHHLWSVGFKLDKVSSAYWRGDEKREMLQRIYGLAFGSPKELKAYLHKRDEARKRDHRKLGKALDLFVFSDKVGAGLPLFTPKGTAIIDALKNRIETICKKYGFVKVMTPHLARLELYEISGHAGKFGDELFHVNSKQKNEYIMKPVQCPHQTQIYASRPRSYRDLPIRYMESEKQYRSEKSGEIGGLNRVIAITVEDGHSFCTLSQVKAEVINMVNIIKDFYSSLGMWGDHWVSLSLRDYQNPDKYIGEPSDWDVCEKMLADISNELKLDAKVCEGEAALYGPKLDFVFKDALERDVQIPTVQLDFATPKRFGLVYTDESGNEIPPVMVHRAILGSYERFLALLIEHFAGAFPVWMAPVQVKLLPIAKRHVKYAEEILDKLVTSDIRVEIDPRNETIGKKIRESEIQKIPYMAVIGDKEIEDQDISIRQYKSGDLGSIDLGEFIRRIKNEN